MKPFFVLIAVFLLSLAGTWIFQNQPDYVLSGRLALSAMLVFTAAGHFAFSRGMAMMLPEWLPFRVTLVHVTGILEFLAAAGIFVPGAEKLTGISLILFFILVLPANIRAARIGLNYQTARRDGEGLGYLWFRIPFQMLLIVWTYFFLIMK